MRAAWSDAERFLAALEPNAEGFTFQTFADSANARVPARVLNGTLVELAPELHELNDRGAGVFVTVCRTDLRGRRRANILRPRAVFCDFDGVEPPAGIGALPPSVVVQSRNGKHVYWLLDPESAADLDHWSRVQEALALELGADPACKDPPRVMRLPGTTHRKREPFEVQLLECHCERRYELDQIIRAYELRIHPDAATRPPPEHGEDGPADDFRRRGDWSFLSAHGWMPVGKNGVVGQWSRPGKEPPGVSATTDHGGRVGMFYVFSSNAAPFDPDTAYSRFQAYCLLEHGGDLSAAARQLVALGFGGGARVPASNGDGLREREGPSENASRAGVGGGASDKGARLVLNPHDPLEQAREFLRRDSKDGLRRIHTYVNALWRYDGRTYRIIEGKGAEIKLAYGFLDMALKPHPKQPDKLVRFAPKLQHAREFIAALKTLTELRTAPAAWLTDSEALLSRKGGVGRSQTLPPASEVIPCLNGLLWVTTGELLPHTPRFFSTSLVECEYDLGAPEPLRWNRLLEEIWPDDEASWDLLHEWLGYTLTGKTSFQKMLIFVGPTRSGKGTVARVERALLGRACGSSTLGDFARPFGLQSLRDKSLIVIHEARIGGRTDLAAIVERLLGITGEDEVQVDVKNQEPVHMRLPCRLMLFGNESPKLPDNAAALAGRFVALFTDVSFVGKEEDDLLEQLVEELPGILLLAVKGAHRLFERGRFVQPPTAQSIIDEMRRLASSVREFVEECADVGVSLTMVISDGHKAFREWCVENGHRVFGSAQFGRDIHTVVPGIVRCRPKGPGGTRPWTYSGIALNEVGREFLAKAKKRGEKP